MADGKLAAATEAALDADGLAEVTWGASDSWEPGALQASPQDARGRGMLLSVTRGGAALDLTGAALYLVWRHRQTHARGCVAMEAVDATAGRFRAFWPAAMAAAEGSCECEALLSWGDRTIASPAFDVEVGTSLVGTVDVGDGFTLFVDAIKRYEAAEAEALGVAAELVAARDAGEFDGQDGADGKDGAVGPKGDKGDAGPAGADGAPGRDGTSCTHSWDGTVLTVTSASGTSSADLAGPQGPMGERGETGPAGPQGETGATGPQGPKGEKGDVGPQGAQGEKGADGTSATIASVSVSVDATTGTPSANVTLGGTATARTLAFAFSGLKGETGATGAKGADGTTPDLSAYATKAWVAEQFPDLSEVSY